MKWNPFKKKETFLCAKYDYKMDIAVKQEEAFADGKAEGAQQKAIEAAKTMLLKNYPTNDISEITGLSIEKVLELQKLISEKA